MYCATIVLLMLGAGANAKPDGPPPFSIGFISHYPMIREQDDLMARTGANVVTVRAPWALVEPAPDVFDFHLLDDQLRWADAQGQAVVLLLEGGPAHAAGVKWLCDELRAEGHMQARANGDQAADPSFFSLRYKAYLARFIARTVAYAKAHPLAHRILGYNNGCEWWYPLDRSLGSLDRAAFRRSLQGQYGGLERLNQVWGTRYEEWADVEPPDLVEVGTGDLPQGHLAPAGTALDHSFCDALNPRLAVTPGQELTFRARVSLPLPKPGVARLQLAWLDDAEVNIRLDNSALAAGSGEHDLVVKGVAPAGASRAWLHVKALGPGEVVVKEVSLRDSAGRELAPNPQLDPELGGWQQITWTAGEPAAIRTEWAAPGEVKLSYSPQGRLASGAKWPLAPVGDWLRFRAETMAEFIGWFATEIKATDPQRPVISYLTIAFANPFEWDYTSQLAIETERVARLGEDIDVLGLQINSSLGDSDSVACALDLARRFGKPLWAYDLIDLSLGTDLGEQGLIDLSRRVLDSGGSGIQYYCWWGTPRYNYLDLGVDSLARIIGGTRDYADSRRPFAPVQVALVQPRMPLLDGLPEPPNDWADFMGWYKLLASIGINVDVWTADDLVRLPLGRYTSLVVPDCAYLSAASLAQSCRAQERGARVISSGRLGRRDMTGRRLESALPKLALGLPDKPGASYLGETYRVPSPSDTPPRIHCAPGSPRPEAIEGLAEQLFAAGLPRPAGR